MHHALHTRQVYFTLHEGPSGKPFVQNQQNLLPRNELQQPTNLPGEHYRFQPLLHVQEYPSPFDASYTIVRNFQIALQRLLTTTSNALIMGHAIDPNTGFFSMEGYVVGRMITEISRIGDIQTANDFIAATYRGTIFRLDDLFAGAFSHGCDGQATTGGLACYCTRGNTNMFIYGINTTTGLPGSTRLDIHEVKYANCHDNYTSVTAPWKFLQLLDSSYSGTAATTQSDDANTFSTFYNYPLLSPAVANEIITAYVDPAQPSQIDDLVSRYNPVGFVGSAFSLSNLMTTTSVPFLTVARVRYNFNLNDAPVTQWTPTSVSIAAVLADYCHGVVSRFIHTLPSDTVYTVAATMDTEAALAVKSLNTFQANPAITVIEPLAVNYAALLTKLCNQYKSTVIVVSQTQDVIADVVQFGAIHPTCRVGIVCAEEFIELALQGPATSSTGATAAQAIQGDNMYFTTVVKPFWVTNASSAFNAVNGVDYSPVMMAKTYQEVALVQAVLRTVTGLPTTANYIGTFYAQTTFSVFGSTIGPFSNAICSALINASGVSDGSCQCGKAFRNFYSYSVYDWAKKQPTNSSYTYQEPNCGVKYLPLIPPPTDTTGMIIGIVVGVVVGLMVLALILFMIFRPRPRDNSNAVQSDSDPITIVFTDIQSSTALWARVPEQMSRAVEMHHAEIRTLISKYNGYEVKTIGDSFMIVFKVPNDAIHFSMRCKIPS